MAVLDVAKDVPGGGDVAGGLEEGADVALVGAAVVVLIASLGEDGLAQLRVCDVGEIAVVGGLEVLEGGSADDVPAAILVVGVPHHAVGVLGESLLSHEIGALEQGAVGEGIVGEAELGELVAGAELLVVAVPMGVVDGSAGAPMGVDLIGEGEEVVVLPEVIRGARPEGAVGHLVARGASRGVVAVVEVLVEGVEASQTCLVEVVIVEEACAHASVVPVEELAAIDTIPRLSRLLVVADVLVADLDISVRIDPRDASEVASAVA